MANTITKLPALPRYSAVTPAPAIIISMRKVFTATRLFDGSQLIVDPAVLVEDGRIRSIASRASAALPTGVPVEDFADATLAPAFFDIHIHGAAGHDVMEATPDALHTISRFLATRGTGSFLATTVTAPLDATLRAAEGLADLIEAPHTPGHARPIGIHLEGPFLSHEKRGVQPPEHLLAPSIATFDRLYDAACGHVRLITLAPELPGAAELIAHSTARGVRVSLGHSNATAAETRAAINAGASSATHTFNAMRPLDHREPGILGVVLTTPSLYAELICDGIHTASEMVRLWRSAKGPERAILVTDAISATGMPDGEYQLGGFTVHVANGRAMARGVLAGSVLTLDRALTNYIAFTGASLDESLPLLTANPAAMTGLTGRAASIAPGMPANFVVLEKSGQLRASILDGQRAA
jgi:N-acetylglucosamine-6-phosphate deacetylase